VINNETGDVVHKLDVHGEAYYFMEWRKKIMYVDPDLGILTFDILTGQAKVIMQYESLDHITPKDCCLFMCDCNGKWLVFTTDGRKPDSMHSILVVDLVRSCSVNQCLHSQYVAVEQCSENPTIFYGYYEHRPGTLGDVDVLQMTGEGKLARVSSFPSVRCYFGKIGNSFVRPRGEISMLVPNGSEMFLNFKTDEILRMKQSMSAFLCNSFL